MEASDVKDETFFQPLQCPPMPSPRSPSSPRYPFVFVPFEERGRPIKAGDTSPTGDSKRAYTKNFMRPIAARHTEKPIPAAADVKKTSPDRPSTKAKELHYSSRKSGTDVNRIQSDSSLVGDKIQQLEAWNAGAPCETTRSY
jgi:hypothetical protein